MELHTLKEFMEMYNPKTIQLLYGNHLINIETDCIGSIALIWIFINEKYFFKSFNNYHLILEYIKEV